MEYLKKSFSVTCASSDADPEDLAKRWAETFGTKKSPKADKPKKSAKGNKKGR